MPKPEREGEKWKHEFKVLTGEDRASLRTNRFLNKLGEAKLTGSMIEIMTKSKKEVRKVDRKRKFPAGIKP